MALCKLHSTFKELVAHSFRAQTYEACDVGTLPNQTLNGLPEIAVTSGDPNFNNVLSYLPGQRLSSCTCPGEEHPGPQKSDGTFVGRAAPEIDVFEAQVSVADRVGHVSQSVRATITMSVAGPLTAVL
jgi:beta-glucan synthesis-associated protein KRE6